MSKTYQSLSRHFENGIEAGLIRVFPRPAAHAPRPWAQAVRRRAKPARLNSPEPNNKSDAGSGVDDGPVAGPSSTKETLSRPFELSLTGSPFRNCTVVAVLVAVNVVVNSCHVRVVVHVVQLFSKAPSDVPFSDTSAVLVVPNTPLGS